MECVSYDVIVVGSGAGGLAAALTVALRGQSVLVVEKANFYGGTTALSGGAVWVPSSHVGAAAGAVDPTLAGEVYLESLIGSEVAQALRNTYVQAARAMAYEFECRTKWVRWRWLRGYPDYHPELAGGSSMGRAIEPLIVDGRSLGHLRSSLREGVVKTKGLSITIEDYRALTMILRRGTVRISVCGRA